jgi:hypothetical protein
VQSSASLYLVVSVVGFEHILGHQAATVFPGIPRNTQEHPGSNEELLYSSWRSDTLGVPDYEFQDGQRYLRSKKGSCKKRRDAKNVEMHARGATIPGSISSTGITQVTV